MMRRGFIAILPSLVQSIPEMRPHKPLRKSIRPLKCLIMAIARTINTCMMNVNLTGIRACVFDAYGTLFDVNSAAERTPRRASRQMAAVGRGLASKTTTVHLAAQPDRKARRFLATHWRSPRLCFGYIEAAKTGNFVTT